MQKHDLILYVCVNWYKTCVGVMDVHMHDGLEGCEFKPWLVLV